MRLFIAGPVESVERATAFSSALGGTDDLLERAAAAGGRIGDTHDHPITYQRQFDDPDGSHWSPFWMKPEPDA